MRLLLAFLLLCARVDAANFVGVAVNTPPEFLEAAEAARIHSAEYWTGERLPDWPDPCVIRWRQTDGNGGGSTSFSLSGGMSGMSMHCEGRRESVLRDVIPHEVDHLVRATILRRKIPRLLDEGAACMFERGNDSDGYVEMLERRADIETAWHSIDDLDYPDDSQVGEFYGFGVSLVRYLVATHGKRKTLQLMDGNPSARWESVLGEPLDETREKWTVHFRGQISRPVVIMYSVPWCGPCQQFWRDYTSNADGLPYVVVKESPPLIGGPQSLPAFVAPNGRKAIGYGRGWQNWDRWAREQTRDWQPTIKENGSGFYSELPQVKQSELADPAESASPETVPEPSSESAAPADHKREIMQGASAILADAVAATAEGSPVGSPTGIADMLIGVATGGSSVGIIWGLKSAAAFYRRRKQRKSGELSTNSQPVVTQPLESIALASLSDVMMPDKTAELQSEVVKLRAQLTRPPKLIEVPIDNWNRAYAWAKEQMSSDGHRSFVAHSERLESLMRQYEAATKG